MSFKIKANKRRLIKYSLFVYTAIIFSISLIAATSLINTTSENRAYTVLADNCPGNSVGSCVESCVWGCNQPGQPYPTECSNGCQAACQNNCATSGPRCGDGSCLNGETWYSCPSDCQDQRPPVDDRGPVDVPTSPTPGSGGSGGSGSGSTGLGNGSVAPGASCDSADDCYGLRCEYPLNTYCGSNGTCGCVAPSNQTVNRCIDNGPSSWRIVSTVSCGSGQAPCSPGEAGCTHIGDTVKICLSCGNPSVEPVYCRTAVGSSTPTSTNPPETPPPPTVNNASAYIDKRVAEDRMYRIGEVVTFYIRIGNNGNTTFTTVRFRDRYETQHLSFISASAVKSTGESVPDLTTLFSSHSNGEIIINDLTASVLGDLAPGQYYDITMRFTALTPTPTGDEACNNAYVRPGDLPEQGDLDCVPIENRDTDL